MSIYQSIQYPPHATESDRLLCEVFIAAKTGGDEKIAELLPAIIEYIKRNKLIDI